MKGEGEAQVQSRHEKRQIEHRQQLAVDAAPDVALGHAHLLHNVEAGLILIALGQLLVIQDRHRRKDKDDTQHDAQEEQAAVGAVKSARLPALDSTLTPTPQSLLTPDR